VIKSQGGVVDGVKYCAENYRSSPVWNQTSRHPQKSEEVNPRKKNGSRISITRMPGAMD
jgi:hypothetical protein